MKRAYLVATMGCLFTIAAFAQHKLKTDIERAELIGPVHTVTVEKTRILAEEVGIKEKVWIRSEVVVYNQAGNMTEHTKFNESGNPSLKRIFSYNDSGRPAEIIDRNGEGIITGKTVFKYNPALNEITESHYNAAGEFISKTIIIHNERGEGLRSSAYDANGLLTNGITVDKNADGSRIETTFLIKTESAFEKISTLEMDRGNQKEINFHTSAGKNPDKFIEACANKSSLKSSC